MENTNEIAVYMKTYKAWRIRPAFRLLWEGRLRLLRFDSLVFGAGEEALDGSDDDGSAGKNGFIILSRSSAVSCLPLTTPRRNAVVSRGVTPVEAIAAAAGVL
jgi:hypothetical protein